eukprot:gene29232-35287_t
MDNTAGKTAGAKRKSRFETDEPAPVDDPPAKKPALDISAAALRAAEISRELSSKIALVSSLLQTNNGAAAKVEKKPAVHVLRLDDQGREIDEHGNVVKHDPLQIKTIAANLNVNNTEKKKKENPYLAHRSLPAPTAEGVGGVIGVTNEGAASNVEEIIEDDRIITKNRDKKVRKALHFVEPGKYVEQAQKELTKEEMRVRGGYASGRRNLKGTQSKTEGENEATEEGMSVDESDSDSDDDSLSVPPLWDMAPPVMEWWDEHFLPKARREERKVSKAAQQNVVDYSLLQIAYSKTYTYIQHPPPFRSLADSAHLKTATITMPVYLTKKERKKMRKAARMAREQEKRDKQLLGLIPAPEPKFKLSNFMKILKDTAVSDPSKVEQKVIEQMQKRILNHEMRNLSQKLTPKERKQKKTEKLLKDTSHGIFTAIFRVSSFVSVKNRFKVDVNAQQLLLSGGVIMVEGGGDSLVVVEGGGRGVRKFIKLMTERIDWSLTNEGLDNVGAIKRKGAAGGEEAEQDGGFNYHVDGADQTEDQAEEGESDSDDEGDEVAAAVPGAGSVSGSGGGPGTSKSARCDLLWSGTLPKRLFQGFKYHEAKTSAAAKKLLEGRGAGHYWDMLSNANQLVKSATQVTAF